MKSALLISLSAASLLLCACRGGDTPIETAPETAPDGIAVYDRAAPPQSPIVDWVSAQLDEGLEVHFADPLDAAAAEFVQLALHMGRLDADYVDAYHGPPAWQKQAAALTPDPAGLAENITALRARLQSLGRLTPTDSLRTSQLDKLLRAMQVRLTVIQGGSVSFVTEVSEIYDEVYPDYNLSEFDTVLGEIDALLPGEAPLAQRVTAFRNSLAIPKDRLQTVFDRAIGECRARTLKYFDLPETESFTLSFVTDKAWSGYNYYQGGYKSRIEINTDFPIIIDRAVDLGCHEGYPGHHVWNLLIEKELVETRGWIEYSVNPLFGPFGPIAEGSANAGIRLAFPGSEKLDFEREVLFPLAGLDAAQADTLDRLNQLTRKLSHATNEIARHYLDGTLTYPDALAQMQKYYLASAEKSAQRLRFVDKYRGYVINYNIGRDRAEAWMAFKAPDGPEAADWAAFQDMLITPLTPGDIEQALSQ